MSRVNQLRAAFLVSVFPVLAFSQAFAESIIENHGYYHVKLELSGNDFLKDKELISRDLAYSFSDGGLFEVYISGEKLSPVSVGCERIIVRMPWTDPEYELADEYIERKQAVLNEINDLEAYDTATIFLELNPYIEKTPDGLRLTSCNVFFRHSQGAYIPHTDPLTTK